MIASNLKNKIKQLIIELYASTQCDIQFQKTKKDFVGDITIVVFSLLKISKKNPEKTAYEIGIFLKEKTDFIEDFNVIKGFLNISFTEDFWINKFNEVYSVADYGFVKTDKNASTYLVEFSSPNTNKPLHLGHIRNIVLGYSVSEILKAAGHNVKKVQIINDRGIHICKSMVAWKDYGCGETPVSSGIKGDHLVGKYYVEFDKKYRNEIQDLISKGVDVKDAEQQAPIFRKAQDMLLQWESRNLDVINLWKKMNDWVYSGFNQTYDRLGISFDKNYYESDTYLLGKEVINLGLNTGVFYKKDDGSVWIDLSDEGLDEKILLRSDGTSVYMTQDIGTAIQRHKDFTFSNMVYTVGNEQDYHFKVLFLILSKLGYNWAENCFHLSYGMVDLPSGKMKSREGSKVDADDLMQEMTDTAKGIANDLGKLDGMSEVDANILYEKVGLAALKYYILKVDPKKNILFNPEESIDFNGNTGPFIQYTYARIQSLVRAYNKDFLLPRKEDSINESEKRIIKKILQFPFIIKEAAGNYSPALIANYVYDLAKEFNHFYQSNSILNASTSNLVLWRLCLSVKTGEVIKNSMRLLGIKVPDRM
tara:strand:- start:3131 stop:4903 length:1773 start_codon:yes stop_codon:yes gene_type:complete